MANIIDLQDSTATTTDVLDVGRYAPPAEAWDLDRQLELPLVWDVGASA